MRRLLAVALAFSSSGCVSTARWLTRSDATREVYSKDAVSDDSWKEPSEGPLRRTHQVPPLVMLAQPSLPERPPTLAQAYEDLQYRCMAAEIERGSHIEADSFWRLALTGFSVVLGIGATAILASDGASHDPWKWLSTAATATSTGISTFVIGYQFEKRIDGNRESLSKISKARDNARASFAAYASGEVSGKVPSRYEALQQMAEACNDVAYFERSLMKESVAVTVATAQQTAHQLVSAQEQLRDTLARQELLKKQLAELTDLIEQLPPAQRAKQDDLKRSLELQQQALDASIKQTQREAGELARSAELALTEATAKRLSATSETQEIERTLQETREGLNKLRGSLPKDAPQQRRLEDMERRLR